MSSQLDHPDVTALALGEPPSTTCDFAREDGLALEMLEIREMANLLRGGFALEPKHTLAEEQRQEILAFEPDIKAAPTLMPPVVNRWKAAERKRHWIASLITTGAAAAVIVILLNTKAPSRPLAVQPAEEYPRFDKVNLLENVKPENAAPGDAEKRALSHRKFMESFMPNFDREDLVDLGPLQVRPLHTPNNVADAPPSPPQPEVPLVEEPLQVADQPLETPKKLPTVKLPDLKKSGKPKETEFAAPKPGE